MALAFSTAYGAADGSPCKHLDSFHSCSTQFACHELDAVELIRFMQPMLSNVQHEKRGRRTGPFEKKTPSGFNARTSAAGVFAGTTVTSQPRLVSLLRMLDLMPKSYATTLYTAPPPLRFITAGLNSHSSPACSNTWLLQLVAHS